MRDRQLWPLLGLTALGGLLRFTTLDTQSFWYDEAFTVHLVSMDFADMLTGIASTERTPPLYYALAWAWAKGFGTGEVGLRALSALLGTMAIPVFYAAAVELCSRRVGLAVAALAAVNPLLVWYSQEARSYALLTLLGALSLYLFARLRRAPEGRLLALWAATSALAVATHYFAAFLVIPQALWLAFSFRRWRALAPALALPAVVTLALAPLALDQEARGQAIWDSTTSLDYRVGRLPKQFLMAFDSPLELPLATIAGALAAAGVLLAIISLADRESRGLLCAAVLGAGALALPFVLAIAGVDYFETRNLIAVWLPLMIVVAAGLTGRRAGRLGVAAVGVLCALGATSVVGVAVEPTWQRHDWRGAAAALGPARGARAIVAIPYTGAIPVALYRPRAVAMPARGARVSEIALLARLVRGEDAHPGPPPRLRAFRVPGFHVTERRLEQTYTLVRLRACAARHVTQAQIVRNALRAGVVGSVQLEQPTPGAARRRPAGCRPESSGSD